MIDNLTVLAIALAYLVGLFALAHVGEARGRRLMQGRLRPLIFALTLGVYCTSWTFLGSVGLASRSGLDFLPIYLGPILVLLLGAPLLERMVRLAKEQNITSIADFVAARYGKSQRVAALVTIIVVVGVLPYVALQLKAISVSIEVFIARPHGSPAMAAPASIFGDLALLVALILALFAILFGTRQIDATEKQDGLMLAIAAESLVKLVAFLAVGIWVTWGLFDGPSALWRAAVASPAVVDAIGRIPDPLLWVTMTSLAAAAIILLPRQFHVTVVENRDPRDLRNARWLFPLYLVAINLFVIPIAAAGLLLLPEPGMDRDTTVLVLPLAEGARSLAVMALIGGLSAATAMVIVECVALAIMVSNDLYMPVALRRRAHGTAQGGGDRPVEQPSMEGTILMVRRAAIIAVLLLGYAYYRLSSDAALATIGLLAFAAIAQIAPAFLGGFLLREANARGAAAGLLTGLLLWVYTMLLPTLADSSTVIARLVAEGPFGLTMLRPTALFGMEASPLIHGTFVSLAGNTLAFVVGSLMRAPTPIERLQANVFLGPEDGPEGANFRLWRGSISVDELRQTVARYLGEEATTRAFRNEAAVRGVPLHDKTEADVRWLRFAEHLLASAIGASSSRLVLSLLLRRRTLSNRAALKLLDDASAAMQHSRELLQHALDHARQGVTVFDSDLRLLAWNRAFVDLFALPPDIVRQGVPLDAIISHNAARGVYGPGAPEEKIAQRITSFVRDTEPVRLSVETRGIVLEIRSNHLPDGGIVTTYTDITEAVAAERALARANETLERRVRDRTEELTLVNRELQRAKAEAEAANRSKTRFLAAASHDILQPLNAARLYAGTLVERSREPALRELSQNVETALEAVEEILTALLDISRLDSGAMKPQLASVDLGELFGQLAIEFEPLAAAKGLRLTFVRSSCHARSDRRLLRRLLQNLIGNALKYTERGGVVVGVRRVGRQLRIEVHDTGIGIPADRQKLIFREFQRLDEGAHLAQGLGLGLSIVERIARLLDHRIGLSSTPGRGSTFSVQMPRATAALRLASIAPTTPGHLGGLRILCIDNEPAILDGMRTLLEAWGCTVITAGNAAEAEQALAQGDPPDGIVADYHLAQHGDGSDTGLAIIRRVRSRAGAGLPSVLLTADRSTALRAEAEALGIPVLNKPLKPAALRAALAAWALPQRAAE